jgi:PAS domain S-box-containing protein
MPRASTILVIDDDPLVRATLDSLLTGDGYQIVLAVDGADGLAKAAAFRPDVVLLDVMMPAVDGFEVCRRLRADSQLAEVPILMLTALDNRTARLDGLRAGADDFISKPFDVTELRTRVRTITRLNRYRGLLAERAKFAKLVEISPNGILVLDEAGLIRMANQSLARMLGVESGAALEGRPFSAFVAPAAGEACAAAWRKALAPDAPSARIETQLVQADGQSFPAELSLGGIIWEGQPAAQMLIRDITIENSRRSEEAAIDEERRRIAHEIHDGLAQNLAALRVRAGLWHDLVDQNPAQMHAELDMLQDFLRENIRDVRRSIFALRPLSLEKWGFFPALRQFLAGFGEQNQLRVDLDVTGPESALPSELELVLFRIVQEAMNNVGKHARAQNVSLDLLLPATDDVILNIHDDGQGFESEALEKAVREGRVGLKQMRERVEQRRGTFAVQRGAGQGTTIHVTLPRPEAKGGGG